MRETSTVFGRFGTTIFTTMSALAREHGAINLGQGFPDDPGPDDVRAAAADHSLSGYNQYPPSMGLPELRAAVAHNGNRFFDLGVTADNVLVTSGGTEALAAALLGLINPGDEVVLIEPLYDSYLPIVELAGGIPKFIRLLPPDWELPLAELEAAFSDKTKLVLLNSPMNPTGKVFTADELDHIADLCCEYDAYAVCDEVYEHLTFDVPHIPLMSRPDMAERTVRIGSAGKTLSLTGWKVGYLTGPEAMIGAMAKSHQFLTFTTPPNLQSAVALGLGKPESYFTGLAEGLRSKRDRLKAGLEAAGYRVLQSDGTYFLTVDFSGKDFDGDDTAFCTTITTDAKVAAVPMSAFYAPERASGRALDPLARTCARFCFCKHDDVLDEAIDRLHRFGL